LPWNITPVLALRIWKKKFPIYAFSAFHIIATTAYIDRINGNRITVVYSIGYQPMDRHPKWDRIGHSDRWRTFYQKPFIFYWTLIDKRRRAWKKLSHY
jgi:hypothetical protein